MDNPVSSISDLINMVSSDSHLTPEELDNINAELLAYVERLHATAAQRQLVKHKQQNRTPKPEPIWEGDGELIDLGALNLFDVPYYSEPNRSDTDPDPNTPLP